MPLLSIGVYQDQTYSESGQHLARLNGFNIYFNMRSTQLLNQMSGVGGGGGVEQVVQHLR